MPIINKYYWIQIDDYEWEPAQYTKYGWLVIGDDVEVNSRYTVVVGELCERNK